MVDTIKLHIGILHPQMIRGSTLYLSRIISFVIQVSLDANIFCLGGICLLQDKIKKSEPYFHSFRGRYLKRRYFVFSYKDLIALSFSWSKFE